MFSRLLVGLDGSPGAEAALTAAIELAQRFHSTITLAAITDVRALEPARRGGAPSWVEGPPSLGSDAELASAMAERGRRLTLEAAERVRAAGLEADTVQAVGFADQELLALAERAEALVVGRRGALHGVPGSLGGTTTHVVRRATRPVLVAGERPSRCRRPVVAYEGGGTSSRALALAARYADALQLPLDVVHVSGDPAAAQELLARAAAFLAGTGVAGDTHHLRGEVTEAVADFVERSGADLLVTGARTGRHRAWGLGSRAERLLRATPVPTIVVR